MCCEKKDIKKIAFFAPNLEGGGAERVVSILVNSLANAGFCVDLILAKATGPYLKNISNKVNLVDLNSPKISLSFFKLTSYLIKSKPHVLFSSQMHASTVALWAVKVSKLSTKVIIRQPTMLRATYDKKRIKSKIKQKLFLWSSQKWASKIILTSQKMADEFLSLSNVKRDKTVIIFNPVPVNDILAMSEDPLEHDWFMSKDESIILAVGRLVHVKDFETLIYAFHHVRKELNARLVILGDGPLRTKLQKITKDLKINDYVDMPGFTPNPFKYMRRCDVFVMSSLWEGFPNSILEAMICGAKVVATDCEGGTSEILENGKWGKLVKVQSPKEMATEICNTLQSSALNEAKKQSERYSLEKISQQYINLISNEASS